HLIRRLENAKADAYSCPLIIDKVTGRKFGKSEGNAVWLDSDKTSIFDFYQFWLNQADDALEEYVQFYTVVTPEGLSEILAKHAENPGARYGQRLLAYKITEFVHGSAAAESAQKITAILFGDGQITDLSAEEVELLAKSFPTAAKGTNLLDILVETGLASSKGEGRKFLEGNAISVNGAKITEDQPINELALIKRGKNKFALVK
ncbi:tyrosine--tRNA ligase, partial [Candidatus Saccharibacteria bacterium]|nr:tyrosine--tRNA ligase [Candidatus Saccharibacteria bacterium]